MAFTAQQQQQIIAEANRRAIANGTTVAIEIGKEAQKNGLSMEQAEQQMGYPVGTLGGKAGAQGQQASPLTSYNGPPNPVNSPPTPTNSIPYYGPPSSVDSPATPTSTNLGMGSKLDDTSRSGVIAEAQRRAAANGTTAEAELYKYSQSQGQTPAQLDALMGFSSGSADSWARQNAGQNGVAAPSGNSYPGPTPSNIPPPDSRSTMPADTGWSRSASGGNLGFGSQQNPYLLGMGADIGNQLADTWNRQILPGTRSSAISTGNFGGSRQGVVEANAMNDLGRNYVSGLTNLYSNDWTGQQNRNLQNKGLDQSYDLGLRNNDLGFGQLDYQINQGNFNNGLAAANFGLGVQDYLGKNNVAGINAGTNIQNTQLEYQKYLNAAGVAAGGAGGTRTGTTTS